jgi:hypothetical protein
MSIYEHLIIKEVKHNTDRQTGETRIQAVCERVDPDFLNINLSSLDADTIQSFKDSVGKTVMVPVRHGVYEGRPFTAFDKGQKIIPTSSLPDRAKSTAPKKGLLS